MSDASETPASASADLEPGTNVGGYLIDAKIGEGGMGVVYGAHHPRIGKRVAIKVLARAYCGDPAVVERFEQEARFVNEIKHPNIVDVFQFGELADKRSFFVMEWLEGEPLSSLIDRGPISAGETIEILDVICDALQAAHEAKVVHRDLKSDNVFLVTNKRGKRTVKLLDFGLAKLAGRGVDGQPVGTTKSGILVGTPAYMSPEQARSKPVDGRTDVYALGVLAYKMLTGTLPFPGDNAMDIILQQLNKPAPNPSKLAPKTPPELSKLVVRMMAKSADERPSLVEIRDLFAKLGPTAGSAASSDTGLPKRKKPISTTFGDDRP
ncbi:MAG TPA: serine/threonine-protein kinase, partial [Kofleriaceae bacterium]|nr:serine/threonine-protein kinase [Kofleriaceae bacterium]